MESKSEENTILPQPLETPEVDVSGTPKLIDLLAKKKPKSVGELREILPSSITDRLGEGDEGLARAVGMLRNLARYSLAGYDGWYFNDRTFAVDISSNIYFPELNSKKHTPTGYEELVSRTLEAHKPMLALALEGGILEKHESWAPPEEIPDPYLLPPSTQLILRRIFKH